MRGNETSFDRDFNKRLALMTDRELAETLLEMQKGEQSAQSLDAVTWYSNRIDWCAEEMVERKGHHWNVAR